MGRDAIIPGLASKIPESETGKVPVIVQGERDREFIFRWAASGFFIGIFDMVRHPIKKTAKAVFSRVLPVGIEPTTLSLRGICSTN